MTAPPGRLPGLGGTGRTGIVTPGLETAVDLVVTAIGGEAFHRQGPVSGGESTRMPDRLGVDRREAIPALRPLRCRSGSNPEPFPCAAPDQRCEMPRTRDAGRHRIARDDADTSAAVAHPRAQGVSVQGEPATMTKGPPAGGTGLDCPRPGGSKANRRERRAARPANATPTGGLRIPRG